MSNRQRNDQPIYRVSFSRITGQDRDGKDILSYPREIGAVWPRKNGKEGAILSLDIIPVEMTLRQGVIFLSLAEDSNGGSQ